MDANICKSALTIQLLIDGKCNREILFKELNTLLVMSKNYNMCSNPLVKFECMMINRNNRIICDLIANGKQEWLHERYSKTILMAIMNLSRIKEPCSDQ